jgi:hypothetical protein
MGLVYIKVTNTPIAIIKTTINNVKNQSGTPHIRQQYSHVSVVDLSQNEQQYI